MVREATCGMTGQPMRDPGLKTKLTEREFINGLMEDDSRASGKITTCMEKVSTLGRMAVATKESI